MNNRIIGTPRRPSWSSREASPLGGVFNDGSGRLPIGGFSGADRGLISDLVYRRPMGGDYEDHRNRIKTMPFIYGEQPEGPAVIPLGTNLRGNQIQIDQAVLAGGGFRLPERPMFGGSPVQGNVRPQQGLTGMSPAQRAIGSRSPLSGTPQGMMPGTDNMRPVPPRPAGPTNSMTPQYGGLAGLPGINGSGSPLADSRLNALTGLRQRIAEAAAGMGPNAREAAGQDAANFMRELDAARAREQIIEPEGDNSRTGMFGRMAEGQVMTPDRGLGSVEALRYGESPLVFNRQMTDEQAMDKVVREGKGFTRTNKYGERAYTSRRQAAQDRVAALKAAGVAGSELDDAVNEANRLVKNDAEAMGRYRANQQKFRDINGVPDGMSERDFRKQQRRDRAGMQWMQENRINPNSPLAKTLYPNLTGGNAGVAGGRSGGPPSPLTAPSGTPRAAEEASRFVAEQAPSFPVAKALGVTSDWGASDVIKNLHEKDMQLEVSDVAHLQQMMAAYQEKAKAEGRFDPDNPYGIRTFSNFNDQNATLLEGMFNGLMGLQDDRSRQQWASEWASRKDKWHTPSLGEGYRPPSMGSPGSGR